MKKYIQSNGIVIHSEGFMNDIEYHNFAQFIFLSNSHEEEGLWDSVMELAQLEGGGTTKEQALQLLKDNIDYFLAHDGMYLIYADKPYDTATSKVLDKKELLNLTLQDIEFKENGPSYHFSSVPEI